MNKITDVFASLPEVKKILDDNRDGKKVSVFGVQTFTRAVITSLIGNAAVICSDFFTASKFARAIRCFTPSVCVLREREETLLPGGKSPTLRERFTALGDVVTGKADVVVTTAQALMQIYPTRSDFLKHVITVKKGDCVDPDELADRLTENGYKREAQLSDACRFSRRGDIVDVYPVNSSVPYRIEFFGDEVDRITELDPETQLSVKAADDVVIYPFTDVFDFAQPNYKKYVCPSLEPDYSARADELISALAASGERDFTLPLAPHCTLSEFLSGRTFVIDECKRTFDAMEVAYSEHKQRFESLFGKGETLKFAFDRLVPPEIAGALRGAAIAFHAVTSSNRFFDPQELYVFRSMNAPRYVGDHKQLVTDVENWTEKGYKVAVLCADDKLKEHVVELLSDEYISCCSDYSGAVTVNCESGGSGEILHDARLAVVCENDLIGAKNTSVKSKKRSGFIGEPKIGEYVVHDVHGVGMCEGVKKVTVGSVTRDYVVVGYAGGDKLYVPVENMDSLTRYVSGGTPRLNKMGGAEFTRQKIKARESIKKLAFDLKSLYAERFKANAYRYSEDDSLLHEFENTFEYTETDDQLRAVQECLADLKSPKIMDRLLCGDVGYGKTEVALRVAFKVISEGKQVAFLSPTTVLAKQHYETVVKRFSAFGIKAGRLTRFDSPSKVRQTLAELAEGKIDVVVGTHRLLSKDVSFSDLGLLILDEEQRFGVGDKEKIKNLRREVNVLTLSATPIPRTLHMSMVGIRDMSLLETPPLNRLPVQTYVTEYSDALLYDAVSREMGRKGQTFIVYNRVEHINEFAAKVGRLLPDARIIVAHGQMPEGELEKAVDCFVSGEGDVMISSTIIENGVDIPRANTLVVIDADTMGLSTLYQLRGRVGRSDRAAYAFFTYRSNKLLSKEAYERLESIGKYTELGSGFKIAMRDLEIRGAGNILGAEQHGHMEKVGYETYCALLEEVLGEMEGKPPVVRKEVRMSVDYGTFVPDGYVTDPEWKLRLYSRISRVSSVEERNGLLGELADMYGPVPDGVKNLVNVALIKNLAAETGASAVVMNKRESKVIFDFLKDLSSECYAVALKCGAKLLAEEKPALKFNNNNDLLKFLRNCRKLRLQNV
ncbi:MAG: transcription-repair coupling factor [Candidatus Neoclostridium sp.]